MVYAVEAGLPQPFMRISCRNLVTPACLFYSDFILRLHEGLSDIKIWAAIHTHKGHLP